MLLVNLEELHIINNARNLRLRIPRKLPIIFHNLQGYDGHIILKN